jgi:hypothetical protein
VADFGHCAICNAARPPRRRARVGLVLSHCLVIGGSGELVIDGAMEPVNHQITRLPDHQIVVLWCCAARIDGADADARR